VIPNSKIKPAAIVRAGYEYQDLVGIEVLIRHFRDPNLFHWVEVECQDQSIRSLDDIVALRRDGAVEYVQVKFTVDPSTHLLDWDWLLARTRRGTSLLAKWTSAFLRAATQGPIHTAQLRTNRRPDTSFGRCLNGGSVDLSRVDAELRSRIVAECGGAATAARFFSTFCFKHSLQDLDLYEQSLRAALVPTDTDDSGWRLLRHQVRRWATYRNDPPPDGRILREHLAQIITRKRPRPLQQDFRIPDGYAPPSESFDTAFRERIANPEAPITVLWGTPGRGKSSYLSYLTSELQRAGNVVIRHHYFLASDNSTAGRMAYVDIADSLVDQIEGHYHDVAQGKLSRRRQGRGLSLARAGPYLPTRLVTVLGVRQGSANPA
jgi:hypothetical protein